ncbi:MAG: RluA family pseudouridine synthase [Candidatus Nanopelagicales bacterium]|jgi:23S rRNA pseudouridine1911/1915/1917 synthase|nr:RluA family pseudouridine synthase [Candidatus Nanopelagicales bacterium]
MSEYLLQVDASQQGLRIDALLSSNFELSRTKVAADIDAGSVLVNGKLALKSHRVVLGDKIVYNPIVKEAINPADQVTDIPILFADEDVVVIDKPVGVAVHPSPGWEGPTVIASLNALGHRISTSGAPERQGIVHRLDVGTSGVMVVAKSELAYESLKNQFRERTVKKIYHALVQGHPDPSKGTIDAPIDRHPQENYKYAVVNGGKDSVTHYETIEAFAGASLLKIELETGRTHQIRVHMAAIKHPCVGDSMYGADPKLATKLELHRQWLHATQLTFLHPKKGQDVTFNSTYPQDLSSSLSRIAETYK